MVHPAIQITDDGSQNIYNGICDWVYEEEVFATKTAAWLSPDNKKLVYVQFDDSPVNHITIPVYGVPGSPRDQYPGIVDFPYPKTGSNNPLVKLFSVDLTDASPNETVEKVKLNFLAFKRIFNSFFNLIFKRFKSQPLKSYETNSILFRLCHGQTMTH